ncbi:hypothetical protein QBC46DRAFT_462456 [Diplogelasinospora grovesii]|uniref:Rhodopsin domain-containing protein n=1 Tax=Diplogelasinospora grovesii TaxID=303347 RepID=A0AAN6MWG7_9PEZI|nr:hypothetical protein QBC46DRAFT_462456 [Diplogelasinospora grovesii]
MNASQPSGSSAFCGATPDNAAGPDSDGPGFPFWGSRSQTDDLGPTTWVSVWVLAGASLLFILLRLYCKFVRHRRFHADDYFAIAAWVALLGSAICTNMSVNLGYGKHVWQIPFASINEMFLIGQITVTLVICSQAWSKTSFAITLLMISDGIHGKTRIFIWFAVVSMNLLFGIAAMMFWVNCTPIEKSWHPSMNGTCWSPNVLVTYGIFTSAYSGIMDLVLAIIPWKIIMSLQMQTKEKIGVALAMSMGVFICLHQVLLSPRAGVPRLSTGPDDGVTLVIWGIAEAAVTIMAASVPMLRVLVRSVRPSHRHYHRHQSQGRSTRHPVETTASSRRGYYNRPRKDLVPMTGSTWSSETRSRRDAHAAYEGMETEARLSS